MYWNKFLFWYAQTRGGLYLGGEEEDGLLLLTEKDQPLVVNQRVVDAGRAGILTYTQARTVTALNAPYQLTIGAEKALSRGVNAARKVLTRQEDYGCPEVTRSRSIRTDSPTFTRLVLGSPDLRRALASSPGEKLKVAACPEQTELHLLTVTGSGGFGEGYLGDLDLGMYGPERRKAALEAYFSSDFLPRMDQFLALLRALRDAVTQWPVPEK